VIDKGPIKLEKNLNRMRTTFCSLLIFLLLPVLIGTANLNAASPPEDCGQFVQRFYDWYLARENALTKENSQKSADEVALSEKASVFSSELVRALREDSAASKKSPGEIVGLDFDPFLNAQDVPERYLVGKVQRKSDHWLVEVFGLWNGKKNSSPDVIPELVLRNGRWIFVNFHYPESKIPINENLLGVLKELKKSRGKTEK
jgi:hypothetical protein